jgi:hypothetical protein
MIHHEEYSGEVDSLLWATKLYVEVLLVFHIDYGAQFSSINEAMEFVKARSNLEKTESEVRRLSKFVALAKKL